MNERKRRWKKHTGANLKEDKKKCKHTQKETIDFKTNKQKKNIAKMKRYKDEKKMKHLIESNGRMKN